MCQNQFTLLHSPVSQLFVYKFLSSFFVHKQISIKKGERRHYKLTDILQPTIFADGNNGVICFSKVL